MTNYYISRYSEATEEQRNAAANIWYREFKKSIFDVEAFHLSFDDILEELWATYLFEEKGMFGTGVLGNWYPKIQDVLNMFTNKFATNTTRLLNFKLALSSLYGTQFKGKRYVCSKIIFNREDEPMRSFWEPVKKVRPVEELEIIPENIYFIYAATNRFLPKNEYEEYYNLIAAKIANKTLSDKYFDKNKSQAENIHDTMQKFMNGFAWEKFIADILGIDVGTSHKLKLWSIYESRNGSKVAAPDLKYKDTEIECKVYKDFKQADKLLVDGCHKTKICLCYIMEDRARAWGIVRNNSVSWYRYNHGTGIIDMQGNVLDENEFSIVYDVDGHIRESGKVNSFKVYKMEKHTNGGAEFKVIG